MGHIDRPHPLKANSVSFISAQAKAIELREAAFDRLLQPKSRLLLDSI